MTVKLDVEKYANLMSCICPNWDSRTVQMCEAEATQMNIEQGHQIIKFSFSANLEEGEVLQTEIRVRASSRNYRLLLPISVELEGLSTSGEEDFPNSETKTQMAEALAVVLLRDFADKLRKENQFFGWA